MKRFSLMLAVLLVATVANAKQQRISIDNLPEDGTRPYLLVFVEEEPSAKSQQMLDNINKLGLGGKVRYVRMTPSHARWAEYRKHHQDDLPCIVTINPDASAILATMRGTYMPDDALEIARLMGLDIKGKLFNRDKPPYWLPRKRKPQPKPAPKKPDPKPAIKPDADNQLSPATDAVLLAALEEDEFDPSIIQLLVALGIPGYTLFSSVRSKATS